MRGTTIESAAFYYFTAAVKPILAFVKPCVMVFEKKSNCKSLPVFLRRSRSP
jgi:hypothetical protein